VLFRSRAVRGPQAADATSVPPRYPAPIAGATARGTPRRSRGIYSTDVKPDYEFEALRATIRERGTARMVLLPVALGIWAAVAVATTAAVALPIAALVPLVVLAAGFEAIYALHVNVERIGRYIQVFHEQDGGWEHVAMAFGQRFPGRGSDALFSGLFLVATALNFLPIGLGGTTPEMIVAGFLHLLLAIHIGTARRRAARQRRQDLERFTALRDEPLNAK